MENTSALDGNAEFLNIKGTEVIVIILLSWINDVRIFIMYKQNNSCNSLLLFYTHYTPLTLMKNWSSGNPFHEAK
jgi:hypothetical protein